MEEENIKVSIKEIQEWLSKAIKVMDKHKTIRFLTLEIGKHKDLELELILKQGGGLIKNGRRKA